MRKLLPVALLCLTLAIPAAAEQSRQPGGGRYDQQIQQQVAQDLQKKDALRNVRANVDDGMVTLEGRVSTYRDKLNAQKIARKAEHAQGVRNLLQVTTTVPDQELQNKLADKLRYDRVDQGIVFNSFNLKVRNGVVEVGGKVRDYPSAASAIALVENTPGVKDVIDNIEVLPVSTMDDELRIRLARAIYSSPPLQKYAMDPQAPIRILVDHGHVTLDGVVNTPEEKQIAGVQASSVAGVFSVKNNLLVAGRQPK